MAYTVKLGIGLNPTAPGTFVDFSSNSADGVSLLGEPPFKWDIKEPDTTLVRRGIKPGKRVTYNVQNNGVFTLFLDMYASNQTALISKIEQVNRFITLARLYDEYGGTAGAPIFITIQMHNTTKLFYLQVIAGIHIGVDTGKLDDASWLSSIGREYKISLNCLPEIIGEKVSLFNIIPNGDFQNDQVLQSNTGGIDDWAFAIGLGWSIDGTSGYFGPNCAKFTGSAGTLVYQNISSNFIPISTLGVPSGTNVCLSFWLKRDSTCTQAMDARISYYNNTPTNVSHTSQAFIAIPSNMTGASDWTQYYVADVIPSSSATQFRLEFYISQSEATSFHMYLDGIALWVNQTVPPVGGEYMTPGGNNICPTRVYNVQGTEPAFMRLGMDYRSSTWAAPSPQMSFVDLGVSPHECGGALGVIWGNTGLDKPFPMFRATTSVNGTTTTTASAAFTADYIQRYYLVKARIQQSFYSTALFIQDSTSLRQIDSMSTIGVDGTLRYLEIALISSPDTMTAQTGGLESVTYGVLAGGLAIVGNNFAPITSGAIFSIPNIFMFRTDWGFAKITIGVSVSPNTWVVYDSTSGAVQLYNATNLGTTGQTLVDNNGDFRGSVLRLLPGGGIVNDIQIASYPTGGTPPDINIANFAKCYVEYFPKYKGLVRS